MLFSIILDLNDYWQKCSPDVKRNMLTIHSLPIYNNIFDNRPRSTTENQTNLYNCIWLGTILGECVANGKGFYEKKILKFFNTIKCVLFMYKENKPSPVVMLNKEPNWTESSRIAIHSIKLFCNKQSQLYHLPIWGFIIL